MPAIQIEDQLMIPAGLESLADFRRWTKAEDFPEKGRIDYFHGRIEVDMSPERLEKHGKVRAALARVILALVEEQNRGDVYLGEARLVSVAGDLSCEPDILFVSAESLRSGRVRYVLAPHPLDEQDHLEVEGGADLVVEIVSPASLVKDTQRLPSAYFAAGVREFWLVDARGPQLQFLIHRRGTAAFEAVTPETGGFARSAVLGKAFRLVRKPGLVENTVTYRLEARE